MMLAQIECVRSVRARKKLNETMTDNVKAEVDLRFGPYVKCNLNRARKDQATTRIFKELCGQRHAGNLHG